MADLSHAASCNLCKNTCIKTLGSPECSMLCIHTAASCGPCRQRRGTQCCAAFMQQFAGYVMAASSDLGHSISTSSTVHCLARA